MTPELKAAAERVRRIDAGESYDAVYGPGRREFWKADCLTLCEAYLAEHLADDDEPATLDFMESVVPEDGRVTIGMRGAVGHVYIDDGCVDDGVEIKTRGQLRDLLKGLGQ